MLLLLGILAIMNLPVTRFPEIAPPSVLVSVSYPGANAQTVAESVLLPIEESINGVEDMTYIRSSASNTGSGRINVYFKTGADPNQAAVNVQTRVSKALNRIPPEVNEAGISVTPRQQGIIMTLDIYSDDKDKVFEETFLQAFAQININRELLRIDGVAEVSRIGARDYSMRVWLNPEKLTLYNLTPDDVTKAIRDQNFEIAPGKFGEGSDEVFETTLRHSGRFSLPGEFESIVVKTNPDGTFLYLRDIARIEFGSSNIGSDNKVNNHPGLTINITQTSGSNAREIDENVRKALKNLSKDFPEGIHYKISYSVRDQIDESIKQVIQTIIEAFVLVFLIVFIFLQDFRSTVIPAIAIPVSLVGTFFFLMLLGFTINVLTMFALVLAIGIVVDDAIVVVEAVHHKMHTTMLGPKAATMEVIKEIGPAIISITLVMAAVFLPVGFIKGPAGLFYKQFAYTLAIAILISALNALTLSPALCALILRRKDVNDTPVVRRKFDHFTNRLFTRFNLEFEKLTDRYNRIISWFVARPTLPVLGLVAVAGIGFLLMKATPTGFVPTEDDGFITYTVTLPPGASLKRTAEILDRADSIIRKRPEVASMTNITGYNAIDAAASSAYAVGYINMYPHKERKGITKINKLMDSIRSDLAGITGAIFKVFPRPTINGFSDFAGVEIVLQDRMGSSFQAFEVVSDNFIRSLEASKEVLSASTSFQANFPQYLLRIDYDKAKALGVSVRELMNAVRGYYGRVQAGDFNRFGRQYRVYMQADFEYRSNPETFQTIFVRNSKGEMVPANTIIRLEKTQGPEIVTRYNLLNAIAINIMPAAGYSSGDVMKRIEEIAAKELPGNYKYEYTGLALEESEAGSQNVLIFILSVLFVYMLLSAQYESYIIPLSVILSIPVGFLGIFLFINMAGLENNIYVQIGLIMLIGLLAKNAILIVEYAIQQRKAGQSIPDAVLAAAAMRLRPILMTSLAFVAGLIPMMFTSGPSAIGNRSISFGAAGGMLSGVFLGIFIIPVLAVIFIKLDERLKSKFKTDEEI